MYLNLSKLSFIFIILTASIFSLVFGIFTFIFTEDLYNSKVVQLENNYHSKNKELIKTEVLRTIKNIENFSSIYNESYKTILKEKVKFVEILINDASNDNLTLKEIISLYEDRLNKYKWDDDTGYFYIFDNRGKILYHGNNKSIKNKNIFDLAKNNNELNSFLKKSFIKDENYGSYKWHKPKSKEKSLKTKYVYIKNDKKYDIYIAAGIYKDELDKKIKDLIFKELKKDRFGDNRYGYFWVHDLDSKMIMHPLNADLVGKNLTGFKTVDDKQIFKIMNKMATTKGYGYINYVWNRPNNMKLDKKVSFVHIIKEWDLVIGAGFYLTELNELLIEEKRQLRESLYSNIRKILLILIGLYFLTLIIARYVYKRILIIELKNAEQLNMLEQYKIILDESAVVSKTNLKGLITYANNSFCKVTGYSKKELVGAEHNIIRHPDTPKSQFKKLWETIQKGKVWKGIIKNKRKDGSSYYNNTTIVPIKDEKGNILEYISSGADVTELIENRTKLQSLFKTDPLTGLGNRVNLINTVTKKGRGVLALLNIDRFKEINDTLNHHIGDEVIKSLANRLFDFFGKNSCSLYRVQADVFAIFSVSISEKKLTKEIEIFMNEQGTEVYDIEHNKLILTYTCGIASNSENLLTFADIALSEAKNKKVKIQEYNSEMKSIKEFKQNLQWVEKLHLAIKEDRIVPHFQAIYNYKTNKVDKYEALMRLIEDGNIINPDEYLDIAKKTKLYPELTYKMVEKTISKFSSNDFEFSINLCVEDLMNEDLMLFIYDYAEQKDVFNRMVLEIVESEEIEDSDLVSKVIKKFKNKGAKVAIDDFGSGYSNYEYLINLQADYIKIDGSITKHILEDERTRDVVKSIVEFAKKSDMKVIAEYVSSKEIDEYLRGIDIDYAQGYYYGKAQEDLDLS